MRTLHMYVFISIVMWRFDEVMKDELEKVIIIEECDEQKAQVV